MTFSSVLSDLFQGLSDLHLGNQNGTWKKLVNYFCYSCGCNPCYAFFLLLVLLDAKMHGSIEEFPGKMGTLFGLVIFHSPWNN